MLLTALISLLIESVQNICGISCLAFIHSRCTNLPLVCVYMCVLRVYVHEHIECTLCTFLGACECADHTLPLLSQREY